MRNFCQFKKKIGGAVADLGVTQTSIGVAKVIESKNAAYPVGMRKGL
jgi:hypothetical protein